MSARRILVPVAASAAATGLIFIGAGAASAAPGTAYPPAPGCGLSVGSTAVTPGQTVTISGSGLTADHHYTIVLNGGTNLAGATTNGAGDFTVSASVPSGLSGSQGISLAGTSCSGVEVQVGNTPGTGNANSGSTSSNLAFTGTPVVAAGIAGLGLLAVGGIVIAAGRRRSDG